MKKISGIVLSLLFISLFTSCMTSTRVRFDSNVEGAQVYLDGEYIGEIPVEKEITNNAFYEPQVKLKKEGYEETHQSIQKEAKIENCISGYFFLIPLIWCYGPKAYQYFYMFEKKSED